MKKLITKISVSDAFEVGKLQGQREAFDEVLNLIKDGIEGEALKSYLKGRTKGLNTKKLGIK